MGALETASELTVPADPPNAGVTLRRILVADPIPFSALERLRRTQGLTVDLEVDLDEAALSERIADYDALIVRSGTRVTPQVIARADRLKVIARAGTGVDNIDIASATKRGIPVMNVPGGNRASVAEHTLALILATLRRIPEAVGALKGGRWDRQAYVGTEMCGKTLGIIGLGRVGRAVAERARAFDVRLIGVDPFLAPERAAKLGIELTDLPTLLRRADIITVHAPLSDNTLGMIGARELSQCKDGVVIANTARGGIVDETALLEALEGGKVAAAALDVYAQEPTSAWALIEHPRAVCTPHLGASTTEAQDLVAQQTVRQVIDALVHGVVHNAVNVPPIDAGELRRLAPYLDLAERLGSFTAQVADGRLVRVHIVFRGELVEDPTWPITSAVLKGVLQNTSRESSVNYVNAPVIAHDRGIGITEERRTDHEDFASLVTVRYETDQGAWAVSGTVFAKSGPRIVEIGDGFGIDAIPEGHLLICANRDVPGVIGTIGTLLGDHGVNIAKTTWGRDAPGAIALTVINIDGPLPDHVLAEIGRAPHILWAKRVTLA